MNQTKKMKSSYHDIIFQIQTKAIKTTGTRKKSGCHMPAYMLRKNAKTDYREKIKKIII